MSEAVSPLPHTKGPRLGAIVLLSLVVVFALAAYAFRQHNTARELNARNADLAAALQQTRAQVGAINAELITLRTAQRNATPAAPVVLRKPAAAKHVVQRHAEDPRWRKVQAQLDEQGKAIEATRQDLAGARTELSGSIARTHDELVLLEKKGERNYFEFDVDKSKQFRRSGQVGVRLRKANVKHQYADLELLVSDAQLTKKHVNLYEPVVFYAEDNGRPVELVINNITKDHIHGYVSAPKYKVTDLAGTNSAPASPPPTATDTGVPPLRQRN